MSGHELNIRNRHYYLHVQILQTHEEELLHLGISHLLPRQTCVYPVPIADRAGYLHERPSELFEFYSNQKKYKFTIQSFRNIKQINPPYTQEHCLRMPVSLVDQIAAQSVFYLHRSKPKRPAAPYLPN